MNYCIFVFLFFCFFSYVFVSFILIYKLECSSGFFRPSSIFDIDGTSCIALDEHFDNKCNTAKIFKNLKHYTNVDGQTKLERSKSSGKPEHVINIMHERDTIRFQKVTDKIVYNRRVYLFQKTIQ